MLHTSYTWLLFFCLSSLPSIAQVDTFSLKETRAYTDEVDSLEIASRIELVRNPRLRTSISEGLILADTAIVLHNSFKKKNDTVLTQNNAGGFERYTLCSSDQDTVFRIYYSDNSNKNLDETFYFKDNKLICSKVSLTDDDTTQKTIYQGEEYYKDGKVMLTISTPGILFNEKYRKRVSFSWWKQGNDYLKQFIRSAPAR